MEYFSTYNLFSKTQFGFIKGRSAPLQLLTVLDQQTNCIDQGDQVDIVYIDFEKAFDKVLHNKRLLYKLKHYGIHIKIINWIETFLASKNQYVKINGICSTYKPVLSGIPQGSVLGPVLFLIFINDLANKINIPTFLFADDAKLFTKINSSYDACILNNFCQEITQWSDQWLMKVNKTKCNVLSLTCNKSKLVKYDYLFSDASADASNLTHVDCRKIWMSLLIPSCHLGIMCMQKSIQPEKCQV